MLQPHQSIIGIVEKQINRLSRFWIKIKMSSEKTSRPIFCFVVGVVVVAGVVAAAASLLVSKHCASFVIDAHSLLYKMTVTAKSFITFRAIILT
jgi:hypothetical protein